MENTNAKFYHAKGLAYQAEAEMMARSQELPFEEEEEKVKSAIAYFD